MCLCSTERCGRQSRRGMALVVLRQSLGGWGGRVGLWGGSGREGGCLSWSCPRRQGPRDWGGGGSRSRGGIRRSEERRHPAGATAIRQGSSLGRQEPQASKVGPGVLPGRVAAGRRAPPGDAPRHFPESPVSPLLGSLRSQGEIPQRHQKQEVEGTAKVEGQQSQSDRG